MFSVPGWSLSAPLKTQKENSSNSAPNTENGTPATPLASNKRKRAHNKRNEVTADNVAELWETHIEGRKPVKLAQEKKKFEKPEKKRKLGDTSTVVNGQTETKGLSNGSGVKSVDKTSDVDLGSHDFVQASSKKDKNKRKKSMDQLESASRKESHPSPGKDVVKGIGPDPKETDSVITNGRTPKVQSKPAAPLPPQPSTKLTPLQASMRAKLASARFRHLNQTLYTSPSASALDLFTKSPEMYSEYHAGFRQQVEVWPENPVDGYISLIKIRGKAKLNKKGEVKGHKPKEDIPESEVKLLPRTQGACTVADLGCGDARLSQTLQPLLQKLHMKILSFDLHSDSPLVKKADISALPLTDGSVNVVLFCLALMGTNWTDFIDEAWRILHWKGELWVAEIKSRFARASKNSKVVDHSVGKRKKKPSQMSEAQKKKVEHEQKEEDDTLAVEVDGVENVKGETDVQPFVQVLRGRGFVLDGLDEESVDLSNRMFVRMRFLKAVAPIKGKNVQVSSAGIKPGLASKPNFRGKYVRTDPEKDAVDENAVLKPCVYKLR